MITVYTLIDEHLEQGDISALSPAAVWIDLLEPTSEEKEAVQAMLAIDIPTREEMQEIEASSRLYQEGEALYMTAPILSNVDSRRPQGSARRPDPVLLRTLRRHVRVPADPRRSRRRGC